MTGCFGRSFTTAGSRSNTGKSISDQAQTQPLRWHPSPPSRERVLANENPVPTCLTRSGSSSPTGADHRLGALVDGLDDLGVIDSAEVSGCDCEVGVTELTLDNDQ
jgi:hypothetical protein